jgi:hypothetical protein
VARVHLELGEGGALDEVGDVASVEAGVAEAGFGGGGVAAVTTVTEVDLGGRDGGEGSADAVEGGVVAGGGIGGVERGVAEPLVFGDGVAARKARVEGRAEDGDVEAEMALDDGGPGGGVVGGAVEGVVRQAAEGVARAELGGGDETGLLAVRDGGGGGVGGVEGSGVRECVEPRVGT